MTTVSEFNFDRQTGKAYVEYDSGSGVSKDFTQAATGVLNTATGEVYLDDASKAMINLSKPTNAFGFSMIGDSRTDDLKVGLGTSSRNWFNWACAFYKQTPILIGTYGVSGKRSDEYLTNGNFEIAMSDSAQWLIFGFPAVNDISQSFSGYTDTFGRLVNINNVAQYAVDNLIVYAKKAIATGKKVILLTEPGSQSLVASQVAVVHEFNRLLKVRVSEVPTAILYDPCSLLWNPTANATLISFKTNYSGDGTHNQQAAGEAVGLDFANNVLPAILPKIDTAPANISDNVANGTTQLFRNPLFSTLTGGTAGGNFTLTSGNIPANITVSGSAVAGLAATVTSSAGVVGNDITFALSSTGAVSARIDLTTTVGDWNLTDLFEGRIEIDVASGGSNVSGVYAEMYVQTNAGTADWWGNYSGNSGPMNTASAKNGLTFKTRKGGVLAGSTTKTSVQLRIYVTFSAAGNQTITIRRPGIVRYAS